MTPEAAKIVAQATLDRYKQRLACRLQPLIQRSFNDFMPAFVAESMKHLIAKNGAMLPDESLFPEGTKFHFRNGKVCVLIVEQKPQVRTIRFLTEGDKGFTGLKKDTWKLAFPYVVSIHLFNYSEEHQRWSIGGTYAGYSNQPVRRLSDTIYHPNLPNVNEYQVCVGRDFTVSGSMAEQIEKVNSHFWTGVFSTDWSDGYKASPVGRVDAWERLTANDPFAVLRTEWASPIKIKNLLGKTALKTDTLFYTSNSYTHEMLEDAAKTAWQQVSDECKGIDTEDLDKMLLEEMQQYLTTKGNV